MQSGLNATLAVQLRSADTRPDLAGNQIRTLYAPSSRLGAEMASPRMVIPSELGRQPARAAYDAAVDLDHKAGGGVAAGQPIDGIAHDQKRGNRGFQTSVRFKEGAITGPSGSPHSHDPVFRTARYHRPRANGASSSVS